MIYKKFREILEITRTPQFIIFIDLQLFLIAYLSSFLLRLDLQPSSEEIKLIIQTFSIVVAVKITTYLIFKIHRVVWRYIGVNDLILIIKTSSINNIIYAIILYTLFKFEGYPRSVIIIDWFLYIMLLGGVRLLYRYFFKEGVIDFFFIRDLKGESSYQHFLNYFNRIGLKSSNKIKCLIIGSRDAAEGLVRTMISGKINYQPVGILDDDSQRWNLYIHGVKVYGPVKDLCRLAKKFDVEEVIVAIPSVTTEYLTDLNSKIESCKDLNIKLRFIPGLISFLYGNEAVFPKAKDNVKKILVIGGGGYIGSALLPLLLDKGHHVRLLDLFLYGKEPVSSVIDHPNLEILESDFRKVDVVVDAMHNVDSVIHLGAIVGDPACNLNRNLTVEVNLMATRMIAEVAKGSGVKRFIFASTCSVYGASNDILDEQSLLNPISLYARSKLASEQVLFSMNFEKFSPVILRFATIYGLSGRSRFDLVVNLLTSKAMLEDGQITIHGGEQWRPFLHVEDAAYAVLLALEAPIDKVTNQVFNVGSNDQNYTIFQIGRLINMLVPNSKLVTMGDDSDLRNYRVNFDKIKEVLKFNPKWSIEKGIKQVISTIKEGKIQDYRDAMYSNVKFLSDQTRSQIIHPEEGWADRLLNEPSKHSSIVFENTKS